MRARIIVGVVLVMALFCVGTFASRAGDRAGRRQWTVVNFMNPVQVKDRVVMGPVLIVHDDEKMAHGKACTSFYRFDTARGPQEEIVSFHCQPEAKAVAQQTTRAPTAHKALPAPCSQRTDPVLQGEVKEPWGGTISTPKPSLRKRIKICNLIKKGNIIEAVAVKALDESLHRNARWMAPRPRLAPSATLVARVGL